MFTDIVYDDGVLRIARTGQPAGLALAGEVDESMYAALETALADMVEANGHGDLHLDLSQVRFCDAAGLHAMVRLVDRVGDGARVVLRAPPDPLRAMLRIVGWEALPGLTVEER